MSEVSFTAMKEAPAGTAALSPLGGLMGGTGGTREGTLDQDNDQKLLQCTLQLVTHGR